MRGSSDVPLNAAAKSPPADKRSAVPDAPGGVERRRETRFRSQSLLNGGVAGAAKSGPASFLGTTVDLSMGGCLFRTYETLDLGMDVTVTLKLPEGDLETPGRIVHVNEDAVGCRMCGLRFEPLAADSRALLARHISRFAAAEPRTDAKDAGSPAAGRRSRGKVDVEGRVRRD
jgi:c-di-GMP-binding flagellar brake protein YcgR